MLLSLLYMLFRVIFRLPPSGYARDREVEILVLRHQLKVLRRKTGGPKLGRLDRLFLAAAARVLPKARWGSFMVTPATQARNLAFELAERHRPVRFLIRDRDAKVSGPFDEVCRTEGIRVILTPICSPKANAFAERFVRTARSEVLDWMQILGRSHLDRVLSTSICHYNAERPHRGLGLRTPAGPRPVDLFEALPEISRCDLLGGLIHEYHATGA